VSEILWKVFDKHAPPAFRGKLGFKSFSAKPCKQIGFDLDPRTFQVRNITSYTPLEGYDFTVPVEKCLRYTYNSRDSLPFGNGVGRAIYKHTWSIDFIYKFWNIALEIFGSPFILGKAAPSALSLARKVLAAIRQGAPAVLPEGVDAELMQVAEGGLSAFLEAVQHHGEQCAYVYLNSTLTTSVGDNGGNRALGQVHQDTTSYGLGGIRADIERVLTYQLARRFVRYNFGPQYVHLTPRLSLGEWDAVDTQQLSSAFSSLIRSNVLHEGEPVIRERLNLPPASPDHQSELETRRAARTNAAQQSGQQTAGNGQGSSTQPATQPAKSEKPDERTLQRDQWAAGVLRPLPTRTEPGSGRRRRFRQRNRPDVPMRGLQGRVCGLPQLRLVYDGWRALRAVRGNVAGADCP